MKNSYLLIFILVVLSSCSFKSDYNLPSKENIPAQEKLDIDGLYTLTNDLVQTIRKIINTGEETVRFDKGRVYYVESKGIKSGTVFVKNLKKIDKFTYSGTGLLSLNDSYIEVKVNFNKSNNKLIETFELPKDNSITLPYNQLTYILIEKDN